jgi:hypothetical protein
MTSSRSSCLRQISPAPETIKPDFIDRPMRYRSRYPTGRELEVNHATVAEAKQHTNLRAIGGENRGFGRQSRRSKPGHG